MIAQFQQMPNQVAFGLILVSSISHETTFEVFI